MNGIDPPGFKPCTPGNPDSVDPYDWAEAFIQSEEADFARVALWFRNAMIAAHGQDIVHIWEGDEP